jgi:hypothetical protein
MPGDIETHGAHVQYDLYEGNIVPKMEFENIWGSNSDETVFRNWTTGANLTCNPVNGDRSNVVCDKLGAYGESGVNSWWEFQDVAGINVHFQSTSFNFVGDIVGSAAMAALKTLYGEPGSPMGQVALFSFSVSGPKKSYDGDAYGFVFGLGEASDDGSGGLSTWAGCSIQSQFEPSTSYPCHSTTPNSTAFFHGVYNNVNGVTTWASGIPQTLPTSMYYSTTPSWWSSTIPWPAIGPDVTGGSGPGGHAYANPAQLCYSNTSTNTDGSIAFNAQGCYGSGGGSPTPVPTPSSTPISTPSPTPVPTAQPTPNPTPKPTPKSTPGPTPLPTASPTPSSGPTTTITSPVNGELVPSGG